MEQGTKVALVLGTAVLLLGTFVVVSSAQMMSQNSSRDWFGQMMNSDGGMGMNGGDHMGGMGGMGGMMDSMMSKIVVREPHKWTYWCKVNPRLVERLQQVPSD